MPSSNTDPFNGLDPGFAIAIKGLIEESGGAINVRSGYRSNEEQQYLYDKVIAQYGRNDIPGHQVAKPGSSQHNHGLAVDLGGDLNLAHRLAPKYGLHFPVAGEAWHAEPIGGRDKSGRAVHGGDEAITIDVGGGVNSSDEYWQKKNAEMVRVMEAFKGLVYGTVGEADSELGAQQSSLKTGTVTGEHPNIEVMADQSKNEVRPDAPFEGTNKLTFRKPLSSGSTGTAAGKFADLFNQAGQKYGVDPRLLSTVAKNESGYNPSARSPSGAVGLMQFMPGTAKGLGVNPLDPASAVDGAARMLKGLIDKFGSVELALAAYNAGPGAVQKYKGVPPFKETQNYVKRIMAELN